MAVSLWEKLENASDFPLRAMLSLTSRCPLSCGHCYLASRDAANELAFPEIEVLLDELLSLGVFQLTLTGGEPGLRDDLEDILSAAWERKFLITLKTSAALFERTDIARLREHGLSALHVSIHHAVAEEHDRFVGRPGAWRRAVDALEVFRDLGGVSVANMVVMEWNARSVEPIVRLCAQKRWSLTVDPKVVHTNEGGKKSTRLGARGQNLVEAMLCVPNARRRDPTPVPGQPLCNAGKNSIYIKPDGEVWLCPIMPVSIGNVRQRSLRRIWNESDLRLRVMALKWSDADECMSCPHNRFCERCPGEAFQEHGDFGRPATVDCAVAEAYSMIWSAAKETV